MTITLLQGDARALPLPDASVDLVVTSPPYFALRSYRDGGEHYAGQIGSEPSPAEFIEALLECTREMARVLKPTGSIFLNLGDKFSNGQRYDREPRWVPAKSLMLLPERYRIACVDQLGLIARAVVIWSKPNGLPESVTDRVRRSHEDWVHLTKEPRYFAAVDEIRETYCGQDGGLGKPYAGRSDSRRSSLRGDYENPLGKLPGSVWEIATQPLNVPADLGIDHFAAFPMEWPRRIILGWSPSGICVECGEGRRPVIHAPGTGHDNNPIGRSRNEFALKGSVYYRHAAEHPRTITGYACDCPEPTAPTRPAVMLDPFGGTGTTALVADALGRHGISVDMSADYCRLAQWRTTDPKQRERASRPAASKRKPEPTPPVELVVESVQIPAPRLPQTADEWLAYFAAMT